MSLINVSIGHSPKLEAQASRLLVDMGQCLKKEGSKSTRFSHFIARHFPIGFRKIPEHNRNGLNAEGVREFQRRIALWQHWENGSTKSHELTRKPFVVFRVPGFV